MQLGIESRGKVEEATPHLQGIRVQALDRVEDLRRVVAHHLHRLVKQIEAARCDQIRQRLHSDEHLGDQVGQPLRKGRVPIMRIRRRIDHFESDRDPKESRYEPMTLPPYRAKRNLEAAYAVTCALRPEQRMRRDDIDMRRKQLPHEPRRFDLHRSDIENQRSSSDVRGDGLECLSHARNGNGDHHNLAPGRLGQSGASGEGPIENTEIEVRRKMMSGQTSKSADADEAKRKAATRPMGNILKVRHSENSAGRLPSQSCLEDHNRWPSSG